MSETTKKQKPIDFRAINPRYQGTIGERRRARARKAEGAADSGACRSMIPFHVDHGFQSMPITLE